MSLWRTSTVGGVGGKTPKGKEQSAKFSKYAKKRKLFTNYGTIITNHWVIVDFDDFREAMENFWSMAMLVVRKQYFKVLFSQSLSLTR